MSGVCSFTVWRFVGKRRDNYMFRVLWFCMKILWFGLTVKGFPGDVCRVFRVCMSLIERF